MLVAIYSYSDWLSLSSLILRNAVCAVSVTSVGLAVIVQFLEQWHHTSLLPLCRKHAALHGQVAQTTDGWCNVWRHTLQ